MEREKYKAELATKVVKIRNHPGMLHINDAVMMCDKVGRKHRNSFNKKELGHIAINYALSCMGGFVGSFDEWYNNISPSWRKIANGKGYKRK